MLKSLLALSLCCLGTARVADPVIATSYNRLTAFARWHQCARQART